MAKYRVREIKLEGDQVGIILEGTMTFGDGTEIEDGFAVWIPADEYKNMTIDQIKERLKREVKNREEYIKALKKEKDEKEKAYKDTVKAKEKDVKAIEIDTSATEG